MVASLLGCSKSQPKSLDGTYEAHLFDSTGKDAFKDSHPEERLKLVIAGQKWGLGVAKAEYSGSFERQGDTLTFTMAFAQDGKAKQSKPETIDINNGGTNLVQRKDSSTTSPMTFTKISDKVAFQP